MRILLTNDDGIHAPGLAAIYHKLTVLGQVQVVAPLTVQSASGHGVTLHAPMLTQSVTVAGGFTGIAVDGRPADCVKLAISQLLPQPPDLVVSGINSGANVGINVLYSGTVAAAVEAAFLGLPAIALSLYLRSDVPTNYDRAAEWSIKAIDQCRQAGLRGGQVVSVNLPALDADQRPTGTKIVRQCTNAWVDTYEREQRPDGRVFYHNRSIFALDNTQKDTDVAALREGYITITPLQFDLTHSVMMRDWLGR